MDDDLATVADGDAVAIHAGFPNPALERFEQGTRTLALDLNQLLIRRPSSTYLFRIKGHAWESLGVYDGDLAVIDRSLPPRPRDRVIAWQSSGFIICRFAELAHSNHYWGVVTSIIHEYRR